MISRSVFERSGTRNRAGRGRALCAAAVLLASAMMVIGIAERAVHAGDAPAPAKELKNLFEGKPDAIKAGEKIFDAKCADCHGGDAMGGAGPDLTDDKWIYGGTDAEVFETVSGGRKGGMPSWRSELAKDDIWKVIAYIRSLRKK